MCYDDVLAIKLAEKKIRNYELFLISTYCVTFLLKMLFRLHLFCVRTRSIFRITRCVFMQRLSLVSFLTHSINEEEKKKKADKQKIALQI